MKILASSLLALALILGLSGVALAADPALGARLDAYSDVIKLENLGTVPISVAMSSEMGLALVPDEFVADVGETVQISYVGEGQGEVSALISSDAVSKGDSNSLLLRVAFPEPFVAPFNWTALGLGALIVASVLLLVRRFKLWRVRLMRT